MPNMREEHYLDNAATTMVDSDVVSAMQPWFEERYGNAETPYHLGQDATEAVENSRERIADRLGCQPSEVYFTSGGTEANNWAVKGFMSKKSAILVGAVEHASVLEPVRWMAQAFPGSRTFSVIGVDAEGRIDIAKLKSELENGDVGLVSVQFGNNEVGTLQPVREIASLCHASGAVFHCDACQAFGKVPVDVVDIGVDMLSVSAHKIHGPVGIGALYVRDGLAVEPLLHGGGHERGMRSGTLPVALAVGFAKAADLAWSNHKDMARISAMVDSVGDRVVSATDAVRNGSRTDRLPHILSLTFPNVEAASIVGALARDGICVSTGSACSTRKHSHVLGAMGMSLAGQCSTVRISFSRMSDDYDAMAFITRIEAAIATVKRVEML